MDELITERQSADLTWHTALQRLAVKGKFAAHYWLRNQGVVCSSEYWRSLLFTHAPKLYKQCKLEVIRLEVLG